MTVSTTINRIQYDGNGSTKTFPYTFKIFADSDLVVIYTDATETNTTWTLDTQYSVTGAGNELGGNVVVETAYTPPSGTRLTIYRSLSLTQEIDYIEGDDFPAETHEEGLDRLTMLIQQLYEVDTRCLKIPVSDESMTVELPSQTERASRFLGFDSTGAIIATGMTDPVGFYTETELDAGQLDNRYYTETEVDTISGSLNTAIGTKIGSVVEDTSPQLGGNLDLNQYNLSLISSPTSDHSVSGFVSTATTSGVNGFGMPLYMSANGLAPASATATATLPCIALSTASGSTTVLFQGFARDDSWNWTVGSPVYVATSPAGGLTQTTVSGSGQTSQRVGIATTSKIMFFNPDYTMITLT